MTSLHKYPSRAPVLRIEHGLDELDGFRSLQLLPLEQQFRELVDGMAVLPHQPTCFDTEPVEKRQVLLVSHPTYFSRKDLKHSGEFKGVGFVTFAVEVGCTRIDKPLSVHSGITADDSRPGDGPAIPPA